MDEKRIAILGSSGGNLYNLGGKDPDSLLGEIVQQANKADIQVARIQFIAASASMDKVSNSTDASLYEWDETAGVAIREKSASLEEINQFAEEKDKKIAEDIKNGLIDGVVLVSADPEGSNQNSLEAAAQQNLPIVGTGGTSMANTNAMGGNVISSSGTTGTTNRTRAISFISNLAKYWGIKYSPSIGSTDSGGSDSPFKRIQFRGIMMAAMPAFISLAIILAISKIPGLEGLSDVFDLLISALPVVLSAIAAKQISGLDEVGIVAGVVAGVLSVEGGIIGGLVAGILAGILAHYIFQRAISWNFPMTTVNIVTGGFAGLISGLFVYELISPIALYLGEQIRLLIEATIGVSPILAGAVAGLLIWPAILGGVYHAAILPIILLEMENAGMSFLGAVDIVGLTMVAAGINLANIIFPRKKGESAVALPGFLVNMGFGTYVESAYPFMFSNKLIFGGAILSGGLGGLFIGLFNARGTAYVPSFAAPFLSNNILGMTIAMLITIISAFTITLIANKIGKNSDLKNN
ncbi:PTS sugar transporter [Virgibacillus sp. NKC19-3]|uniref:PTS sugar transporter n=1 Tax=Virgibacillus saliphilus TaxID=2831674 RepID=UPI001C9B5027|nr:PTS sugar transporter [Virgibacillus sp. NKC19-3]MBY7142233.1 PTS sugar transporter [Virgibacillus sp. NKC19-3]